MNDVQRGAVEVALLVRVGKSGAHAEDDAERVLDRELGEAVRLHGADDGTDVLAVDVLHGDEVRAVDLTDVEDLDDVRVRQRGRDAGLAEQHLDEALVLRHLREDPLDDDQLLEPGDALLKREKELGHSARREFAKERVLAEARRKAIARVWAAGGWRAPRGAVAVTAVWWAGWRKDIVHGASLGKP